MPEHCSKRSGVTATAVFADLSGLLRPNSAEDPNVRNGDAIACAVVPWDAAQKEGRG